MRLGLMRLRFVRLGLSRSVSVILGRRKYHFDTRNEGAKGNETGDYESGVCETW